MAWTAPDATKVTGYTVTATDWDSMEANLAWIATETTGDLFLGVTSSAPAYKAIPPVSNMLMNPAKSIWQRGTSFSAFVGGSGNASGYTADRYYFTATGTDSVTITQDTSVLDAGMVYSLKMNRTVSGSGTFTTNRQILHATGPELPFYPTKLSYRVRVKCSAINVIRAYIDDGQGNQNKSAANTTADAWETLEVSGSTVSTSVAASPSTIVVGLVFLQNDGSTSPTCTVYVGWETLVPGTLGVNYRPQLPGYDLAQCQRYYQKIGLANKAIYFSAYAAAGSRPGFPLTWLTYMANTPTTTIEATGTPWVGTNITSDIAIDGVSSTGCGVAGDATATAQTTIYTVDANTYVLAISSL
jgi:hypothetical protein